MTGDLSARFDLLDQQLVDADDVPFGRVDDAELELGPDGAPRVVAVLTGTQALGERVGGGLGRRVAAASARLRPDGGGGPARIERREIADVGTVVRVTARLDRLRDVAPLERWLSSRLIGRLPGAGDAAE